MFHSTGNPFKKLTNRQKDFYSRYQNRTDEYGFDPEILAQWEPIFRFFYEGYFDVKMIGVENIPDEGRAILVGNHSGGLPIDAIMLAIGILNLHPSPRRIRPLALDWLHKTNIVGHVIRGMGAVPATMATALKLLNDEELVTFYPEGARGTGKRYATRYRLHDFDPGFVKAALLTGAPIIPITTVGGDDIYPILTRINSLAKLLNMPYFPITPTFPLLPITSSCIPLPAKMLIKIGKPIALDYPPEKVEDHKLRRRLARLVQFQIQRELNAMLRQRKNPFCDWSAQNLDL
ncbi:MAG: acyltransferase family protein [Cyanobacteria bacterium REEB67]|nr:acyltransferase family protein [Cyanobacteria bacterium REEB67]